MDQVNTAASNTQESGQSCRQIRGTELQDSIYKDPPRIALIVIVRKRKVNVSKFFKEESYSVQSM